MVYEFMMEDRFEADRQKASISFKSVLHHKFINHCQLRLRYDKTKVPQILHGRNTLQKICRKSGTAKKHLESVKNQRVLKIKALYLVSHSE